MNGILIADDQEVVRHSIKKMITEMCLESGPIYLSSDGEEALRIIHEKRPDIALIDIVMPRLNGFDLIQRIRECNINTRIIIVSSYNDFDFTKRAIGYKVDDYVLKPISKKEMRDVLMSAMESMKKEVNDVQKFREKEVLYYRMLLYEYMTDNDLFIGLDRINDSIAALGFKGEFYRVILLLQQSDSQDVEDQKKCFEKSLGQADIQCSLIRDTRKELIYLINHSGNTEVEPILKKNVTSFFADSFCGVGNETCSVQSLREKYKEAAYALHEGIACKRKVLFFTDIKSFSQFSLRFDDKFKILSCIRHNNKELLAKCINAVFTRMINEKWGEGSIADVLKDLIDYLVGNLKEEHTNISFSGIMAEGLRDAKDSFSMKKLANHMILSIFHKVNEDVNNDKASQIIERIIQYIVSNYRRDISLAVISNELNMNYCYVSGLFAKKAGMPFSEYLLMFRLDKAKELLIQGNDKIYEVAFSTGFSDSQYFCRVFKRVFHITPMKYRMNCQKSLKI